MSRLTFLVLAVVVAGLMSIAWVQGGGSAVWMALNHSSVTLISVLPLIGAAFAITGLVPVVVSDDSIRRWMGAERGWSGLLVGGAVGACIPGGPYVYYPMIVALFRSGASLGTIVTFVSAKKLWGIVRLPVEFALLGPHLALIRFVVTLGFPLLMGGVTEVLFSGQAERIRCELTER